MKVRYAPRATDDLHAILEYVHEQSPQGRRNLGSAIRHTIDLIGQFPESGRLSGERDARMLPAGRYPYLVYWILESTGVWIVHIRDARRVPLGELWK